MFQNSTKLKKSFQNICEMYIFQKYYLCEINILKASKTL